jgi:hypothetical protein
MITSDPTDSSKVINMSSLSFNGNDQTITLFDAQGNQLGAWPANNVVDRTATMRFVPNQDYDIVDRNAPHTHGGEADTPNGPYGSFGIIRFEGFWADGVHHDGVGLHSGRADRGGADHATMGCIRTSDGAMQAISQHIATDPLTTITVHGNHVQQNRHPQHPADHHHNRHLRRLPVPFPLHRIFQWFRFNQYQLRGPLTFEDDFRPARQEICLHPLLGCFAANKSILGHTTCRRV